MDKIKIGLPRGIFYYYFGDLLKTFFNNLDCELIISPLTNKEIYKKGINIASDEMCSALKIYFGHISYLEDKVEYIIVPRIDNYGLNNQTCTNFLALYDLTCNLFNKKIITFNIDYINSETEYKGLYKMAKDLGFISKDIKNAYIKTKKYLKMLTKKRINNNYHSLLSKKKKVLLVAHPYILYDNLVGLPIINYLKQMNIEIIYSDRFNTSLANDRSKELSNSLYFKYSKEMIGSIILAKKYIDGIIFISSFPCGLDSLVNELVRRKLDIFNINIVIDDINTLLGIETRLESFCDILERKQNDK
ncbi:MAG: acyl-CoA dehydratase activase-related protein [Bacilli bacterium]